MSVVKVIELMAESSTSWEDATKSAVIQASKTVADILSVYVQDMSTTVKDGKVDKFRVNVKISFAIKNS